jgi:predicted nucleotidyltransferase
MRVAGELRDRREEILLIAAKHGAANVAVFGSVARGEETDNSDVVLLIDVAGDPTPWFPGVWSQIWKNCLAGEYKWSSGVP